MFRQSLFIAALLCLAPASAHAATTTWNFAGETKIDGWNHGSLTTVTLQPTGLLVRTTTAGQLVKVANLRHTTDTITVSYEAANPSEGIFLWRPLGKGNDNIFQIPVSFNSGRQKLVLDMRRIPQWEIQSDRIGFGFNPGTNLVIEKIEFSSPSLLNRITYGLQAFIIFDQLRPYSVNFLWGPLLASSAEQVKSLFSQIPPLGSSANPVFYALIGGVLVLFLLLKKFKGKYAVITQRTSAVLIAVTVFSWVIYDIRMGAEFISYARKDVRTWWSQPIELKDFRDRGSFNAFLETAMPFVKDEEVFVFVTSRGWPYSGQMFYAAYPALPVASDQPEALKAMLWVAYDRRDITLDAAGRLNVAGQVVTEPGTVLLDFEPGAFVFRINPKP